MSDVILEVEHLWKEYRIGKGMLKNLTVREFIMDKFKQMNPFHKQVNKAHTPTTFSALHDINFTINRGETVGIIGRNGAGKSTLLKVLSKITPPTKGTIKSIGRVTSLLEVGTGFHPELSGRENIFLNGAILGLTRKEIKEKFDEIVEFSGVEKFLDTPLKRYSSGMLVRLAFSVAAHLEPDILIIDEVLAVGDLDFQKKCLHKMEDVSRSGRTILFVSHNNEHILRICKKGILLENGHIVCEGEIGEVIQSYLDKSRVDAKTELSKRTDRRGNGLMTIQNIQIQNDQNNPVDTIDPGKPFKVLFEYTFSKELQLSGVNISVSIYNNMGISILEHSNTYNALFYKEKEIKDASSFVWEIVDFPFPQGEYFLSVEIWNGGVCLDAVQDATIIVVSNAPFGQNIRNPQMAKGTTLVDAKWSLN